MTLVLRDRAISAAAIKAVVQPARMLVMPSGPDRTRATVLMERPASPEARHHIGAPGRNRTSDTRFRKHRAMSFVHEQSLLSPGAHRRVFAGQRPCDPRTGADV